MKEEEKEQIYIEKCMKALTFLDYQGLEHTWKLTQRELDKTRSETIAIWDQLRQTQEELKKERESKPADIEKLTATIRSEITKEHKTEMEKTVKKAVADTLSQMLRDGQIPIPAIMDLALEEPDKVPKVIAAGKEQYSKFSTEELKSMTQDQLRERKKKTK
jgi:hypothetical protein